MKDPQSAQAGSAGEPAAPNSEAELVPTPADYQFSSRKARREAELTGMIPIIVPKNAQAQQISVEGNPEGEPPAVQKSDGEKHDGGTASSNALTGTVADNFAGINSGTAMSEPAGKALPEPAVEVETGKVGVESNVGAVSDERSRAEPVDVERLEEPAPQPVSAVQVTGIPVIPLPHGPAGVLPEAATAVRGPRTPKAGRDLPAAITVGVTLLVLVLGSLLFYPVAFVVLATAFACVGVWEVTRAIGGKGIKAPLTPVMLGALAMPVSAYFAGAEGLLFALAASAGATLLWRSLDSEPGAVKSILAGVFSLLWIPFLLSFVFLMLRSERGPTTGLTLDLGDINAGVVQVMIMLLLVVANDTFGYLVGVLFGKHPMAPKISPKKSWEGFAGSLGGATLVAIPATVFLLDLDWWVGLVLAIGMVLAGTGGDFAESMVKRELGVKDMSNLLPGHGGVMDRLDSILFAAPVAYAIFTVLGQF